MFNLPRVAAKNEGAAVNTNEAFDGAENNAEETRKEADNGVTTGGKLVAWKKTLKMCSSSQRKGERTTFEAASIALTSGWGVVTGNNDRRRKDWEDEEQESEDSGGTSEHVGEDCLVL